MTQSVSFSIRSGREKTSRRHCLDRHPATGHLRWVRLAFLSTMLLLGLVPGLPGALEDAAHLLAEGHTLHDDHHDVDASAEHSGGHDDEDAGCEDCGHEGLCHCHGTGSLAATPMALLVTATPTLQVLETPVALERPARAAAHGLERPPRS